MKTQLRFSIKLLLALSLVVVSFTGFSQTTHVPDNFFESYLETHNANGDAVAVGDPTSMGNGIGGDDYVLTSRINSVTILNVPGENISDLTGIEDFLALTELDCSNNNLTSLDLSGNTALTILNCYLNDISSLNLTLNTALTYLSCYSNNLIVLDLSSNMLLTYLSCNYNGILNLDLTNNTLLTYVSCFANDLISLDVYTCTLLTDLYCDYNDLTSLHLFNNTALVHLQCFENNLSHLNVSNNTLLEDISCHNNFIAELDLSNNPQLWYLSCYDNNLSSLDLSNNPLLSNLRCQYNNIGSLDLSNNPELLHVRCHNNELSYFDIKNGTNDIITYISVLNNPELYCIQVDDASYSDTYWPNLDAQSYYSNDCYSSLTYVPNDAFEQALIDLMYDDVLDNYVLTTNINALTSLYVAFEGIDDLTGIEDFSALTDLFCNNNNLTSLDVSSNTNLEQLYCYSNSLSRLDLSLNTALTALSCSNNSLESLNVKNGNNYNISSTINFNALNNPDLYCIQVDDALWSTANWPNIDDQSYFDEDCSLSVNEHDLEFSITMYPNPVTDELTIDLKNQLQLKQVMVYSLSGKLVVQTNQANLNLGRLNAGFYIVQIETNKGMINKKLIKN